MIGHRRRALEAYKDMVPRQKGGQVRKTTDGVGESIKSATSVAGLRKGALVGILKCCVQGVVLGWPSGVVVPDEGDV